MDIILVKEIVQEALNTNSYEKDIWSILNISLSLLYFYQNRETYIKMKNKKLNLESEQADKGIVDIEEEQSGDIV